MTNKHTVIVIASIVVIAATLGYSSLNLIYVRDLQFRWHEQGSFELLSIMFNGRLVVCNNSDYPTNFQKYTIQIFFDGQDLGTFTTHGAGVAPHSTATIPGSFEAADKRVSQMLFSSLNTALNNNAAAARIDPSKMHVTTTLETKVIGVIPVSITQQQTGAEFLKMMNQKTSCDN
ncbi:MAG: hypothetical protein QW177_03825 [Candidatus Nitrosotenuis sp.]